jgi:GH24 family phage-related lysozyme (muramidase)
MRYPGLEDELAHLDAQGKPAARTEDVNGLGSLFRKRQEDFLKANSDEIASPTSAEEIKKMEEEMDLVAEAAAKFAEPYSYTLNVSPSLIIADPGEGNNTLTEPYSTTLAITVSKNSSTKLINDKNVKLKIQGVDNANLRITEGSSATKVNDDMNTWQANITIPKDVERGKTSLLRVYLDRRENEPEIYYNVSVGVKANTTRPPYTILSTELENTKIIEFIKRYEGDKVDFYIPGSFSPNNGVYQYYGEPLATNVSFEPRESSGVTIGMGIDLGQREISVVKNLFLSAGFDNTLADKYSQFGNKKGQSAVSILYTINSGMPGQKVTITANQKDVLNNTIYLNMTGTMYTRYTNYITNKTLEWVGLPTNAKIALISFYWQFGQSLTAHPNVINNIAQEKWKEAAAAIKGANSETRRIAEANLLLEIIGETPYPYP